MVAQEQNKRAIISYLGCYLFRELFEISLPFFAAVAAAAAAPPVSQQCARRSIIMQPALQFNVNLHCSAYNSWKAKRAEEPSSARSGVARRGDGKKKLKICNIFLQLIMIVHCQTMDSCELFLLLIHLLLLILHSNAIAMLLAIKHCAHFQYCSRNATF